jgi:peptidoglycan DL-endopeptidase CwlO
MDRVIGDARSGVAAIAPATGTPAGKQELVRHLQGQLDRAKDLLKVSEQRNMELAALIERGSAGYNPMAAANPMGGVMGGGMPMGLGGGGGGLGSGFSIPGLDNLTGLTRNHHHDTNQMLDAHDAAISGGSPLAQIAVKAALTKLGKPYVWSAKGPNEFDCSGLTHWAYAQAGITLGPDTYTQIHDGPAVPHGHVEAGDLIFPEAGHVMLAISPTQVIEAQQSGVPVKISPMPSSYQARRPTA